MAARIWYGSVFAKAHHDFAKLLLTQFKHDPEAWVLEVGSFIGNSAVTWAQQAKMLGMRAPVVCIDTWLGDLVMWTQKGDLLGTQDTDGTPRLFQQFMLNVAAKNMTDHVLPVRVPASIGLEYVHRQTQFGYIPQPSIVYIDTAHTYPETAMEMAQAWKVLRPGVRIRGGSKLRHN